MGTTSRLPTTRRRALFAALSLITAAAVCGSCTPQTTRTQGRTTARTTSQNKMLVDVPGVDSRVTAGEIQHASYGVVFDQGASSKNAVYHVAFVQKEGQVSIISGETGFKDIRLTSTGMPERVKDYLSLGPILGIVGDRRRFTVGETYDSVMLRPEGRPHFRYTCDRMQTVGGVQGYHLTVRSVRYGTTELDLVLSPDYPLPLYVREHTGDKPLTIVLSGTGRTKRVS